MNLQFTSHLPNHLQQLIEVNLQLYPHLQADTKSVLDICSDHSENSIAEHLVALFAAESTTNNPDEREQLRDAAFLSAYIDGACWKGKKILGTTITYVDQLDNGDLHLRFDPDIYGNTFIIDPLPGDYVPRVGSHMWILVATYKETYATARVGIVIDGYVADYETYGIMMARRAARTERERAAERAKFPEYDQRVAKLPEVFQQRFEKFRQAPHFREDLEGYELSTCELAVALAERLKTPESIDSWVGLTYEKRLEKVPEYGNYGHSNNSRDAACGLAKYYLENPELVPQAPGAMYLVVGQQAYLPQTDSVSA